MRLSAAGSVDGVAVERVRVQRGGLDVTVNLDASTGRVHSTTFIDRNREGQFGEYTVVYADFRAVDGLSVPFEEKASFNGTADPSLSRKLDSVSINGAVDAGAVPGRPVSILPYLLALLTPLGPRIFLAAVGWAAPELRN